MIQNFDEMTPEQEQVFWNKFTSELAHDDGTAARSHLAAGHPIYYRHASTPANTVIKEYPNGHCELVTFDLTGEHFVSAIEYRANRD